MGWKHGEKKKLTVLHNKNCKLKWDNGFHLSDGQRPKNGFGTIWRNSFGALLISIRLQSAHTLCLSNYTEIQKAQQSIRLREGRGISGPKHEKVSVWPPADSFPSMTSCWDGRAAGQSRLDCWVSFLSGVPLGSIWISGGFDRGKKSAFVVLSHWHFRVVCHCSIT